MTPPTDEARAGEPRPSTEAGRALLYALGRRSWSREAFRQSILAIEREAAAAPALDVDRLAGAIGPVDQCYMATHAAHHDPLYADVIVARLSESTK